MYVVSYGTSLEEIVYTNWKKTLLLLRGLFHLHKTHVMDDAFYPWWQTFVLFILPTGAGGIFSVYLQHGLGYKVVDHIPKNRWPKSWMIVQRDDFYHNKISV